MTRRVSAASLACGVACGVLFGALACAGWFFVSSEPRSRAGLGERGRLGDLGDRLGFFPPLTMPHCTLLQCISG
jgi:hypothetical protein